LLLKIVDATMQKEMISKWLDQKGYKKLFSLDNIANVSEIVKTNLKAEIAEESKDVCECNSV
jgi:hypothetical protein